MKFHIYLLACFLLAACAEESSSPDVPQPDERSNDDDLTVNDDDDTATDQPVCGNGIVEEGEVCDPAEPIYQTDLYCLNDCSGYYGMCGILDEPIDPATPRTVVIPDLLAGTWEKPDGLGPPLASILQTSSGLSLMVQVDEAPNGDPRVRTAFARSSGDTYVQDLSKTTFESVAVDLTCNPRVWADFDPFRYQGSGYDVQLDSPSIMGEFESDGFLRAVSVSAVLDPAPLEEEWGNDPCAMVPEACNENGDIEILITGLEGQPLEAEVIPTEPVECDGSPRPELEAGEKYTFDFLAGDIVWPEGVFPCIDCGYPPSTVVVLEVEDQTRMRIRGAQDNGPSLECRGWGTSYRFRQPCPGCFEVVAFDLELPTEGFVLTLQQARLMGCLAADGERIEHGELLALIDPAPLAEEYGFDPCMLLPGACMQDGMIRIQYAAILGRRIDGALDGCSEDLP